MHPRRLIRDAFVAVLTGLPTTGANVFKSRVRALWETEELPALLVYTQDDRAEIFNEAPRRYERTASVAVEIVARANDDLDDVLDGIADEVEAALFDNPYLLVSDGQGGTVARSADTVLTTTEIKILKEGDTEIGAARLTFDATYYQDAPADVSTTGNPDDLATVGLDWNPGGQLPPAPDDGDHLKDEIEGLDQ